MSKSASRKLSVIIPWCEGRGEGVNHLRKWSEGQTLPRSDYQIVIGYPEDEPEEEYSRKREEEEAFSLV